jgi:hypothetical protein
MHLFATVRSPQASAAEELSVECMDAWTLRLKIVTSSS